MALSPYLSPTTWSDSDHCHLIMGINNQFVWPAIVTLQSFFETNHVSSTIHIFFFDLTESNAYLIKTMKFANQAGKDFHFYPLDSDALQGARPASRTWPKEVFLRLLAIERLDKSVERAFFFDADLVVRGDLSNVYKAEFKGTMMRAGEDVFVNSDFLHKEKIGLSRDTGYVNAGFLVLNVQKLRHEVKTSEWVPLVKNSMGRLQYNDQDVLNILLENRIEVIDHRYFNLIMDGLRCSNEEYVHFSEVSRVLHFGGGRRLKPWNLDYAGQGGHHWWRVVESLSVPAWRAMGFSSAWDPRRLPIINKAVRAGQLLVRMLGG